ncbi:hypothetical protein NQ317_017795 [Molorchus minor]|uniref:Uncharacterized protein n=1 Tax=Molorchus minor TaxID=1323400 RepID=A0ABQ9K2R5_9CUCU|nr:hypothetical protein NQ317_017795 [Molorchus minor]
MSRNRRASALPLIVSAPKNIEVGSCILLGIPLYVRTPLKAFFGKAFEQASERINCDASCDFFDTSCYQIHIKDRTRFFDTLTALLS